MSAAPLNHHDLERSFREHRKLLWGLCYRMMGSTADADDLLQETYARALQHPPARPGQLRPWLVRVAMNLSRDLLRKRRRRGYVGTWLPTPAELAADGWATPGLSNPAAAIAGAPRPGDGETRYALAESASFAFLVAVEALTPQQRAVLLLRDVIDYSVRETAAALGMSEGNVKTTLHRARRAMRDYDHHASAAHTVPNARQQSAIEAFLTALVSQDAAALTAMLAADVRALSDGGGEYFAARVPVVGVDRVARFYLKISAQRGAARKAEIRTLNGQPAMLMHFAAGRPGQAPRVIGMLDLDAEGRIARLYAVLASDKVAPLFSAATLTDALSPAPV